MFRHVQNALDMRQVISAGPFLYFVIQEVSILTFKLVFEVDQFPKSIYTSVYVFWISFQGTLNAKYYSNPDCLWLLANFALKAYVASSRKTKTARLPLIASAPLEEGYCLLVGVPPVAETAPRRYFGYFSSKLDIFVEFFSTSQFIFFPPVYLVKLSSKLLKKPDVRWLWIISIRHVRFPIRYNDFVLSSYSH